jgi:uncharacterized protein YggE
MKLALLLFFTAAAAVAQTTGAPPVPQITVQGNCDLRVIPDRGRVTFSAEHQTKDQKDAVARTNKQITELREEIAKLKLADLELKSTAYAVYPVREWEKDKLVSKGYRATLALEIVTSEIGRLGEAMQKASAVGVTNVGDLQTFLSLEKSREEYLRCLDVAAEDARGKANQLAKKLGFRIGDVVYLNEVPNLIKPVYENVQMKAMAEAATAPPAPIDPGTQQYSTNLQVTFSIQ